MKLFKYGTKHGRVTFTCDGRQFELGFQFIILTGKQEEIVLQAMKSNRNIRQYPVDEIEMANYLRTHTVSNNDFSKATDSEVKSEFYKRFPELKQIIFNKEVVGVVTIPEPAVASIDAIPDTISDSVVGSTTNELGLVFEQENRSEENTDEEIPMISEIDSEVPVADAVPPKVGKVSTKGKLAVKTQL